MKRTAVIFSYDDGLLLVSSLRSTLLSGVDRIVLLYGGKCPYEWIDGISDPRLIKIRENSRKGKVQALLSAMESIDGDIVFLISGDSSFDPSLFDLCTLNMDDGVGVIIVKQKPVNHKNFIEKIGAMLIDIHNFQLSFLSKKGLSGHNGDFMCVRRSLMINLPEVVNEDSYICLKAIKSGYSVRFLEDAAVSILVPSNFMDLYQQRRRINYGHYQISRMGQNSMSLDSLAFNNLPLFIEILVSYLKVKRLRRLNLAVISAAVFIELLATISSRIDILVGKDHRKWIIVKREASS
ncbi:MAG: glycosyltransferase family 2 protein [Thermoplasmatales archaeon]